MNYVVRSLSGDPHPISVSTLMLCIRKQYFFIKKLVVLHHNEKFQTFVSFHKPDTASWLKLFLFM